MSYSSYLKPRPEVISDEGIDGIVDLANLKDDSKTKLESRPTDFLNLTWPTADLTRVLDQINMRFSSDKGVSGLFLFEGLKGSGKSHLLLTIYDLFKNYEIGQDWLKRNNLTCKIPTDPVVIINKFTDNPYDSIWNMIFEALGAPLHKGNTHPKLDFMKKALGERRIVLIFDEMEQGIKVISDPALKAQNIAFLQMISEFSTRSKQVTLFASIYSDKDEPGSTLKRVPRTVVQFDNVKDQSNVVLHRLFENYLGFKRESISSVVESYVQLWAKHTAVEVPELKNRFRETYPFSPSIMDILLKKVPARGGFQNVRGALSFLSNLVRLTHVTNDIITPADALLADRANVVMLKDLDPSGDLVNRAKENIENLTAKVPLAPQLGSAVLLYTLAGRESDVGATRDQLLIDILSPARDINSFEQTLMGFQKYASYFHHQENRYYFDLEENSEAKVEWESLKYSDDEARGKLYEVLKTEIFRESINTAIFVSVEQVQEALKQFDKTRPRYILTGRRLTQEERHLVYHGMDYRNLILLLEPKDNLFQLANDKDLLKWAKRILAAKDLAKTTQKAARKSDYERIAKLDQGNVIDRIKKGGLVFTSWQKYGSSVSEDRVELEPLPSDSSKEKILDKLSQEYFPALKFKEHMEGRLEEIKEHLVKEVDMEYRSTLGFPVPLTVAVVLKGVRELCKEGAIGIQHSTGNFCRANPPLTETELSNAKITAPFEEPPRKVCLKCGKWPCDCPVPPQENLCPVCGQFPCVCEKPQVCPRCGQLPCVCPKKKTFRIGIPSTKSLVELRQEAASRLQEYEGAVITLVTYKIFLQAKNVGDLSTLPSGLRGALSGPGDLTAEISITKKGNFSKGQIESQIEALPSISGAEYSADLEGEISK